MPTSWGRVAKVMVNPWCHPETGMFWFRRAVPERLRLNVGAVLGRPGKPAWELKWTLGTKDIREAKVAMVPAMTKADAIIEAARNGARALTERELHSLAALWGQRQLWEWEEDPSSFGGWDSWGEAIPDLEYDEGSERDGEPTLSEAGAQKWKQFVTRYQSDADDLLSSQNVFADDPSREQLAELIVRRIQRTVDEHHKRQGKDYDPDTVAAPMPVWTRPWSPAQTTTEVPQSPVSPKGAPVSLRGLFDSWKAVAVVKPRTAAETDYAVANLAEFLGHEDAMNITRDDMARWRDAMKAEGRSNNTWNNRLSLVRQIMEYGVKERTIATNPADGLRLRKNKPRSPLPYSNDDAARILIAARLETRPSLRWCHWIMAFTGMRAAESMQLHGGDIRQDSGVWFFDINEDAADKSVKTANRRRVPIHTALVAEGFLAYAQTFAADAPLFPDKPLDKFGSRGGRAWNVIGKWVRNTVGITDPQKAPDHSWRHRVEDELRAVEAPEEVRDAIIGHTRKTTGGLYGVRGEALKRLDRFLSLLPVPEGVFPTGHALGNPEATPVPDQLEGQDGGMTGTVDGNPAPTPRVPLYRRRRRSRTPAPEGATP